MIRLVQTFGAHTGRTRDYTGDVVRIGRLPTSDFPFDPHADLDASGSHAELRREGATWFCVDVGSRNGTFLRGRRITRQAIAHGDELEFGSGGPRLRVELGGAPATARPEVSGARPEVSGARPEASGAVRPFGAKPEAWFEGSTNWQPPTAPIEPSRAHALPLEPPTDSLSRDEIGRARTEATPVYVPGSIPVPPAAPLGAASPKPSASPALGVPTHTVPHGGVSPAAKPPVAPVVSPAPTPQGVSAPGVPHVLGAVAPWGAAPRDVPKTDAPPPLAADGSARSPAFEASTGAAPIAPPVVAPTAPSTGSRRTFYIAASVVAFLFLCFACMACVVAGLWFQRV